MFLLQVGILCGSSIAFRLPVEPSSDVGHRFDCALGMHRLVVLGPKLEQSQMQTIHTWFFFMGADACLVVECM